MYVYNICACRHSKANLLQFSGELSRQVDELKAAVLATRAETAELSEKHFAFWRHVAETEE
jgi:hypothetical protein